MYKFCNMGKDPDRHRGINTVNIKANCYRLEHHHLVEQTKVYINNSVRRFIKIKYHNRDETSFFGDVWNRPIQHKSIVNIQVFLKK